MEIKLEERYKRLIDDNKDEFSESIALKIALVIELEMMVIMNQSHLLPEVMNQYKRIDQIQFGKVLAI